MLSGDTVKVHSASPQAQGMLLPSNSKNFKSTRLSLTNFTVLLESSHVL